MYDFGKWVHTILDEIQTAHNPSKKKVVMKRLAARL